MIRPAIPPPDLAAALRALGDRVDALARDRAQVVGEGEAHRHAPDIVRDTVLCPACAAEHGASGARVEVR